MILRGYQPLLLDYILLIDTNAMTQDEMNIYKWLDAEEMKPQRSTVSKEEKSVNKLLSRKLFELLNVI